MMSRVALSQVDALVVNTSKFLQPISSATAKINRLSIRKQLKAKAYRKAGDHYTKHNAEQVGKKQPTRDNYLKLLKIEDLERRIKNAKTVKMKQEAKAKQVNVLSSQPEDDLFVHEDEVEAKGLSTTSAYNADADSDDDIEEDNDVGGKMEDEGEDQVERKEDQKEAIGRVSSLSKSTVKVREFDDQITNAVEEKSTKNVDEMEDVATSRPVVDADLSTVEEHPEEAIATLDSAVEGKLPGSSPSETILTQQSDAPAKEEAKILIEEKVATTQELPSTQEYNQSQESQDIDGPEMLEEETKSMDRAATYRAMIAADKAANKQRRRVRGQTGFSCNSLIESVQVLPSVLIIDKLMSYLYVGTQNRVSRRRGRRRGGGGPGGWTW